MSKSRAAVFLDRDGTLNVDRSYLTKPADMLLLPGIGPALQMLQAAGFACVLVTNQSAVGRGLMTLEDLQHIHDEMNRQLAAVGVTLDGIYVSTAAPKTDDKLALDDPDRKPAPGLLLRAAAELHLDLQQSWMIGDALRDILAGQNAGCKGCVMVRTGVPVVEAEFSHAKPFVVVDDLLAAARYILSSI